MGTLEPTSSPALLVFLFWVEEEEKEEEEEADEEDMHFGFYVFSFQANIVEEYMSLSCNSGCLLRFSLLVGWFFW